MISFDCEELRKLVRMVFPRPVPTDSQGFDDREHVAKYLYNNGDKRTIQFEHSNMRKKIKEPVTKLKNRSVIVYWYMPKGVTSLSKGLHQLLRSVEQEHHLMTSIVLK